MATDVYHSQKLCNSAPSEGEPEARPAFVRAIFLRAQAARDHLNAESKSGKLHHLLASGGLLPIEMHTGEGRRDMPPSKEVAGLPALPVSLINARA